jgi:hypothetical protein
MNRLDRFLTGAFFTGVLFAALGSGKIAFASSKDACSVIRISQVQSIIGADGKVLSVPRNFSRNGTTASYCTYASKAYSATLSYFAYPTPAEAQSAYAEMTAGARGYSSIKGSSFVLAFVNDNTSSHAENASLSKRLGALMLGAR